MMVLPKTKAKLENVNPPPELEANYRRLYKAEEFFLESVGMTDRSQRFNVGIDLRGTKQFIRTLLIEPEEPSDTTPDLVLIHGFGGSWTIQYLLFPYLTKEFRVWCIDLLGMAGSSRPKFDAKTPEDGLAFFVDSIEAWRQKIGLQKFYLAGHSLGGYISGHYAMKFPKYIIKLILISPGGVAQKDPISGKSKNSGLKSKVNAWLRNWVWNKRWTPAEFYKLCGFIKDSLLKLYVKVRSEDDEAVQQALFDYFKEVLSLPMSSEKCLFYMFGAPGYYGLVPLGKTIVSNPPAFPIDFYYGDNDRMSSAGAKIVCENPKIKAKLFIIANSGHQISMENPKQLAQLMILNKI